MEQPLMNILDECIDRIRAGEPVEACLKDYPEYADELRDMLHIGITLGELVTAAPVALTTQDRLQQQLANRIDNRETHMQIRTREKRKRRTFGMMSLGAAAVLALIMGVGIGVFATMSAFNPSALAPVVAEPTEPTHQLSFRHNPALFSIPREGDTPLYFDVELGNFGEASEYVRIATPTGLEVIDMEPVSLQGWTLSNQDDLVYTFGDESMRSSGIKVHSGYGNEHYGNVYIGQTEPIWRLDDRLILRDANDVVLFDAAVRDLIPATSPNFYDNSLIIYSGVDRGSFTYLPIYVDVINPGTDSEHIRIENLIDFQDFDLSGWTLSSDTGVSYTLPDVEWYKPIGSGPHINIYTLPKATSAGKYHIGLPEPVWQSANTLTLTHPDGLSGTLALNGDVDTPQSPLYDPEYIRPVYRYNDEVGTFMVTFDGQPSTIYQVQVMNPGDRDREYIKIFARENESVAPVPMLSLEGWTLSDDDGNVFVFDSTYLPTTESSLWIYTRDGVKKMDEVYMDRDNAIWDMDDTLTLTNSLGGIVLQANVGALSPNGDSQYVRPVYRYNDAAGVFMVVADGQPTAIFQLQVMNPGYRDHEYINIFAPANVSMNNVRPISLDGWTISDDDGNSFTFDGAALPSSGLRVYTGDGEDTYGAVYMGRDSALWDEDDTLTLSNALGDVVLQANVGTLTYTLESSQTLSNSIYFEDPDIAPTGWMPPFMLNVDVIFPGQEGENVRISQRYGGEMPDLAGWTISDDDGNSYRIPYQDNDNTSSYLSLYTESGTDEPGKYYMGFDAPIWQLDDSLTITRPSDGATYNIIVEDSIESPWHLGNPPTAEPPTLGAVVEPDLRLTQVMGSQGFMGHYGEFTFFGEGQLDYAYDLRIVPSTDTATEHIQINFATQYPTSNIPPISIDGWTIERDGQTIYRFDNVELTREGLKIYTGSGIQSDTELYIGEVSSIWGLEDTLILKDVTGREIISQPVYNLLVDAYIPGEDIQSMRSFYQFNMDLKASPVSKGCMIKPTAVVVTFRDGPYENGFVIRTLEHDETVEVLRIARDLDQSSMWWYQVRTDADEIGWVRQEGMEPMTDCPE